MWGRKVLFSDAHSILPNALEGILSVPFSSLIWCYQHRLAPHHPHQPIAPLLHKTLPFWTACVLLTPYLKDFPSWCISLLTPPDTALTKTLIIFTCFLITHLPASGHRCQLSLKNNNLSQSLPLRMNIYGVDVSVWEQCRLVWNACESTHPNSLG